MNLESASSSHELYIVRRGIISEGQLHTGLKKDRKQYFDTTAIPMQMFICFVFTAHYKGSQMYKKYSDCFAASLTQYTCNYLCF